MEQWLGTDPQAGGPAAPTAMIKQEGSGGDGTGVHDTTAPLAMAVEPPSLPDAPEDAALFEALSQAVFNEGEAQGGDLQAGDDVVAADAVEEEVAGSAVAEHATGDAATKEEGDAAREEHGATPAPGTPTAKPSSTPSKGAAWEIMTKELRQHPAFQSPTRPIQDVSSLFCMAHLYKELEQVLLRTTSTVTGLEEFNSEFKLRLSVSANLRTSTKNAASKIKSFVGRLERDKDKKGKSS